jgi:hypothetical protein
MCELGRIAGSAAEMPALPCGISDFVDRSKRGHASRDAPPFNGRDFVLCFDAFAGRPLGGGTNAFENLKGQRYGDIAVILAAWMSAARSDLAQGVFCITLPRRKLSPPRNTRVYSYFEGPPD